MIRMTAGGDCINTFTGKFDPRRRPVAFQQLTNFRLPTADALVLLGGPHFFLARKLNLVGLLGSCVPKAGIACRSTFPRLSFLG